MFSVEDKFGRVKPFYPKLTYILIATIAFIACYHIILTKKAKSESLRNLVEKHAVTILYTDIVEENLEYYSIEPYCGYKISGDSYNIDTLKRDVKGANILTKEFITIGETITVNICYSTKNIDDNAQKHLLIIFTLFISIILLLRRKYAAEKAEYYKEKYREEAIQNTEER